MKYRQAFLVVGFLRKKANLSFMLKNDCEQKRKNFNKENFFKKFENVLKIK